MKKILLAVVLSVALTAVAGNNNNQNNSDIINYNITENVTNQGGTGIALGVGQGGTGGQGGVGGNATLNNSYNNQAPDLGDLRIVPPAIAPSVSTNIICPMVMQGSKAGSVFFFSGSGTHAPDIVSLCVAWHLGQKDVVEQMTCKASKAYREVNPNCASE
jgi:hypothetical protein